VNYLNWRRRESSSRRIRPDGRRAAEPTPPTTQVGSECFQAIIALLILGLIAVAMILIGGLFL